MTRLLASLLLCLCLTGCAAFRGAPAQLVVPRGPFDEATVLVAYDALTTEGERVAYRNRVAYFWIGRSDDAYDQFTYDLSREMKGSGFGSSMTVLLLNGAAAVSGAEAARALAVASATVVGGSASLKKEVFQDQTITAILSTAEAQRTRRLTDIRRKLLQADSGTYSLGDALIDIKGLNRAANLNQAAAEVTATAVAELAAAQEEAKSVIRVSLATTEVHQARVAFANYVKNELSDPKKLEDLRKLLGAAPNPDDVELKQNIVDAYAQKVEGGKGAVNALTVAIQNITGKEFKQ